MNELDIDVRIILKWFLKKLGGTVWTGHKEGQWRWAGAALMRPTEMNFASLT
jgi:hypothetical protein